MERSGEEREDVPVQKPTNEGREYLERCIQVKRGRRIRPREKERWNGRWIKKDGDRGKVRDEDKGRYSRAHTHIQKCDERSEKVTSVKIIPKSELRKAIKFLLFAIRRGL